MKERDNWAIQILQCINFNTQSIRKKPSLPITDKNFWKYKRISVKEFTHIAETGDVLLFTTPNIGA